MFIRGVEGASPIPTLLQGTSTTHKKEKVKTKLRRGKKPMEERLSH
jgi:hypothetical protein